MPSPKEDAMTPPLCPSFIRCLPFTCAALAAVLAFVCGSPAFAAEKVVFQLGWVPGGDNGIEYLALADGIFAQEGLDVTILSGNGGADTLTKVAAGNADLGLVGLESLLSARAQKKDLPVKGIFGLYNKKPDDVEIPVGSSIKSVSDLAGKKVAIGSFSSSNVVWPLFAKLNGLDPEKVALLKVDSGSLAPMLATGQVEAILNWVTVSPHDSAVMKAAGKDLVVIPWSKFGYEGYGQSIIANETFLANRPDVAKAFLRAYKKAAAIAIKDPSAAGVAVHKIVANVDAAVAAQEFAASIPLISNEISEQDGIGAFVPARLKTTWEWVAKSQSLDPNAIDPVALVDMRFQSK
jgi:NitT/TauT family transport system substrate-binding protein